MTDKKLDYSTNLTHKFPVANEQSKNGLYVVKRTAAFLERVCRCNDPTKDPVKITKEVKLKELSYDAMVHYVDTATQVRESMLEAVVLCHKFTRDVFEEMVKPLQDFYVSNQLKRKSLMKQEKDATDALTQLQARLDLERKQCKKQYDVLLQTQREMDEEEKKETKKDRYLKLEKELKQEKRKTHKAFKAFSQSLAKANDSKKKFHTQEMPNILEKLETIERARLTSLTAHFQSFVTMHHKIVEQMQASQTQMKKLVATLNVDSEMKQCMNNWLSVHGKPHEFKEFEYGLPCTAHEILDNRFDPRSRSSIAGSTAGPGTTTDLPDDDEPRRSLGSSGSSSGSSGSSSGSSSSGGGTRSSKNGADVKDEKEDASLKGFQAYASSAAMATPVSHIQLSVSPPDEKSESMSRNGSRNNSRNSSPHSRSRRSSTPHSLGGGMDAVTGSPLRTDGATGPPLRADGSACRVGIALYDHSPQEDDPDVEYLQFKKGDTIYILEEGEDEDDGWWEGELNGKTGYFPRDFVQVTPPLTILPSSSPVLTSVPSGGPSLSLPPSPGATTSLDNRTPT